MIKGSKPFLIITFLISFSLAFYFANKAFPIFVSEAPFVKQLEMNKNKELPFVDKNGSVLEQIIGIEPNTVQLVYKLPQIVAYKTDTDSLKNVLEKEYLTPSDSVAKYLSTSNKNLILDYIFKDKNSTKLITFKTNFTIKD